MITVTLANRNNARYQIVGRKPLLDELREQESIYLMAADMAAALHARPNCFRVRLTSGRKPP